MEWTHDELAAEAERYRRDVEAANKTEKTVDSYYRYAMFFVRWRRGEFLPSGAKGPKQEGGRSPASISDIESDLQAYTEDLEHSKLVPNAVRAYKVNATRFVRFLAAGYNPRGRQQPRRGPIAAGFVDLSWATTERIGEATKRWLEDQGWSVGVDAGKGAVSARRRDHAIQLFVARTHDGLADSALGDAVMRALADRDSDGGDLVGVVAPDTPENSHRIRSIRSALLDLALHVYLIGPEGSVVEYPEPRTDEGRVR